MPQAKIDWPDWWGGDCKEQSMGTGLAVSGTVGWGYWPGTASPVPLSVD